MRIALVLLIASLGAVQAADHWVGTWAASPSGLPAPIEGSDLTVREIVHTSLGGKRVQIRFTNAFGSTALSIGSAHVAMSAKGSGVVSGSDHTLTFGARPAATIPPFAILVSDPVEMDLPAQSDLAISVFVPGVFPSKTVHAAASATVYLAPGDLTSAAALPADAKTITSWPFLSGVAVTAAPGAGAIVAIGDSITDGARSTNDTNSRWPDVLARRLIAARRNLAVLNAGIGGNRILHDGQGPRGPSFGPNALSRFDRDVIAHPGVKYVIVLEGINDLGHPGSTAPVSETVSAEDIIVGLRQMIERAHAAGLKIFGGTITPREVTTVKDYHAPDRETSRLAVNQWIRTGGAFDGVIDFEKAIRDPEHPAMMLARYDSGDHLHPNDAGYKAMGEAIDLSLFKQ